MHLKKSIQFFQYGLVAFTIAAHSFSFGQPGINDPNFNAVNPGLDGIVYSTNVQPDQKIIIGGNFTSFNGTSRNCISRQNTDGSLDATFNPGTGFNASVRKSELQSDGKIIAGGNFTTFNGTTINRIARLNTNGTLDATFNPGTGFNNAVSALAIQQDGKIIVGGSFTSFNGTTVNRIARLNANGTLDATFNIGTGFNNRVNTLSIQTDGKIIVGGDFFAFNGTSVYYAIRLNANGSIDPTFVMGSGFDDYVYASTIQPDGKIIIGGLFSGYNNTSSSCIARLNSDGTIDGTFNVGTGFNTTVLTLSLQSDGKLIVGGFFSNYNGTGRNYLARLNSDGTLDVNFYTGSGLNYDVFGTAIQANGRILVGGTFTGIDGVTRNYLARLLDCYPSSSTVTETACLSYNLSGTVYTTSGTYTQVIPNALGCDSTITLNLTIDTVDVTVTNSSPTLTANASNATYQWVDCGNGFQAIAGATAATFEATANGNYAVVVTQNGCSDTSACIAVGNVGMKEIIGAEAIQLFPNPTNDYVMIDFGKNYQTVLINLRNSVGQLVRQQNVKESNSTEIQIDGQAGVYFVEMLLNNADKVVLKVIKQ